MIKLLFTIIIALAMASNVLGTDKKFEIISPESAVVVKQKIVEFVNTFPVTDFQYSSGHGGYGYAQPAYTYNVSDNAITEETLIKVAEETSIRVIKRLIESGYLKGGGGEETPKPDLPPEKPPLPEPKPDDNVREIFKQSCKGCHTGSNTDSGFELLTDINGTIEINPNLTQVERWMVYDRVDGIGLPHDKIMPKNGDPLSDEQVTEIRNWVRKQGEK